MNRKTKKSNQDSPPIQSPHAALQAMLPTLRSIGIHSARPPFFETQLEVADFIDDQKEAMSNELVIVPVWAVDHRDLANSQVVKWTFSRYIN